MYLCFVNLPCSIVSAYKMVNMHCESFIRSGVIRLLPSHSPFLERYRLITFLLDSYWLFPWHRSNGRSDKLQGSQSLSASHSVTARLSVPLLVSNLPLLLASQINVKAAGSRLKLGSSLKSSDLQAVQVFRSRESSGNLHVWEPENKVEAEIFDYSFKFEVLFSPVLYFSFLSCFSSCLTTLHSSLLSCCDGPVSSRRSITSSYLIFHS